MYIASGFWSLNRYKSRLTSTPLPPRFTMSPLMTQGLLQINPILFKYKQWITKLTVYWTKRVINDSLMLHIETAGVAESTNVSFFTYSTTDSDYNQSVYFLVGESWSYLEPFWGSTLCPKTRTACKRPKYPSTQYGIRFLFYSDPNAIMFVPSHFCSGQYLPSALRERDNSSCVYVTKRIARR